MYMCICVCICVYMCIYVYIYIYIYSPSSRLGKMINKDNRKRNDEDNAKNQLERSHKRMKTYKQSEDIQIQTYI